MATVKLAHGGWQVKPFAKGRKIKRTTHGIDRSQNLRLSPWTNLASVSTEVDLARLRSKGLLYTQRCSLIPRLVRKEKKK